MTLVERVTNWMVCQRDKHDLGETYVEDRVNAMTNMELLDAISDALEEEKKENLNG
jgi:uncharacterized protein YpiB (UPF0302 family)